MEIILVLVRMVQWLFLAPVWWLASNLSALFYPFEGDKNHFTLAVIFSAMIFAALIGVYFIFF